MTNELLFDLKNIDESAERIVLGGFPVKHCRQASIDRKRKENLILLLFDSI